MDNVNSIFQEYCVINDDAVGKSISELVNNHRNSDPSKGDSSSQLPNHNKSENHQLVSYYKGPRVNVPEKIIFCIDASADMEKPIFKMRVGTTLSPLFLLKRALSFFVTTKLNINSSHQFCLCPMLSEAKLGSNPEFTSNGKDFLKCLDDFSAIYQTDSCDLTGLFTQLKILQPVLSEPDRPPKEVIRLIIIYGRSYTLPTVDQQVLAELSKSPFLFIDIFYIHEHPTKSNQCQAIFDFFCNLDRNNSSYICEVIKNPTALYNQISQLIGHPLQRPVQNQAMYKLIVPPE